MDDDKIAYAAGLEKLCSTFSTRLTRWIIPMSGNACSTMDGEIVYVVGVFHTLEEYAVKIKKECCYDRGGVC